MKFKKLITVMIATTLTVLSTACGKKEADTEYVLKIGELVGGLCHAPLQITMENGYLDEEGIKWERVDFGKGDIQAALGAGEIDRSFGLVGKFVQPIENGLNMVMTSGMHTGCTKLLVKSDSEIKSIKDLKDKTIGVSSLASSEAVTAKRALSAAGVSFSAENSEVEFAVYSTTDQPIVLINGAVDAIYTFDPVATQAQNEYNLTALLDTAVTMPYAEEYCCVSFVSSELAEEQPEIAAGFTRAVLKTSVWVAEHLEETAKIQIEKNYVSGDAETNAKVLASYQYIPSVQGGYDALINVCTDMKQMGLLKESTDIEKMIERSYKFFDDVPDSYSINEDNFTPVDSKNVKAEKHNDISVDLVNYTPVNDSCFG